MGGVYTFVIYLAMLCCGHIFANEAEPKCYSRFDYDEKMLMKLLRFEDELEKFRHDIDELKSRDEAREIQRKNEHEQLIGAMKESETSVDNLYTHVNNSLTMLEATSVEDKMTTDSTPSAAVAFTVRGPRTKLGLYMTFKNVVSNEGDGFDTSTGKFTCKFPGLYYFSLHLVKDELPMVKYASCAICKNRTSLVYVMTGPDVDYGKSDHNEGYYGTSSAVAIRLEKNDVVGACKCSKAITMSGHASFSGVLISK